MRTLNYTLDKCVLEADGRYLETQELQMLEQYVQSYGVRLETYQYLREHNEKLIVMALRNLAMSYPDVIQKYGSHCKRDMTEVLRYVAIAILRDDETFFKDQMMVWLDTILLAHKRQAQCGQAYRNLQEAITKTSPVSVADLVRPYLDLISRSLQSHA